MRKFVLVLLLSWCLGGEVSEAKKPRGTYAGKIQHIIVLMEENRSFDHFLGWLKNPKVNGLKGNESNPISTLRPSKSIPITKNASQIALCDPNHGYPATTSKLFGVADVLAGNTTGVPCMCGFVETEKLLNNSYTDYCGVMETFVPEVSLPVMTQLINEFVLFDHYFCSVPGPTWPNRMFFLSGTSAGSTETGPWYRNRVGDLFPQRTIFDQVADAEGEWRVYYNDTPWELFLEVLAHSPEKLQPLEQFFVDAATGNLPTFAFINPRSGINVSLGLGSNDQHPDHDVALGEELYKSIYEALRASPQWNKTLFVLTYDEHGGFYDHVPPPSNVPPPGDGEDSYPDTGFAFDRLGIRIPTILISPWLKKGKVVSHPPAAQKPRADSVYEGTSVIATARKLLSLLHNSGNLTARDGWSATFEHLFEDLDEPRTDCPLHLVDPLPPSRKASLEAALPLNPLQQHIVRAHANLFGRSFPEDITLQEHVAEWTRNAFTEHQELTMAWKTMKNTQSAGTKSPFVVLLGPLAFEGLDTNQSWIYSYSAQKGYGTLSVDIPDPIANVNVAYCLDGSDLQVGSRIGVTICYPVLNATYNRDKAQHFILEKDATLRPHARPDLCVTNEEYRGNSVLTLKTCTGALEQHYGFHGFAPGEGSGEWGGGWLFFGDDTNAVMVFPAA